MCTDSVVSGTYGCVCVCVCADVLFHIFVMVCVDVDSVVSGTDGGGVCYGGGGGVCVCTLVVVFADNVSGTGGGVCVCGVCAECWVYRWCCMY